MGLSVGDAGGVWGSKRVANLSMSDSSWGLDGDVLVAWADDGSGIRGSNELSEVDIFRDGSSSWCEVGTPEIW